MQQEQIKKLRVHCSANNFSDRTTENYVHPVECFLNWLDKSKKEIDRESIYEYHSVLKKKKFETATIKLHACAIRYFLRSVLNREDLVSSMPTVKQVSKLPVVLSKEEVKRMTRVAAAAFTTTSGWCRARCEAIASGSVMSISATSVATTSHPRVAAALSRAWPNCPVAPASKIFIGRTTGPCTLARGCRPQRARPRFVLQPKRGVGVLLEPDLIHRFAAARATIKPIGEIAHQPRMVAEIPITVHHPRRNNDNTRAILPQNEFLAHTVGGALRPLVPQGRRNSPGPGKQNRSVCSRWAWGPRPTPGCVTER